jgi:Spx/MgsR family transcriptional regulator
MTTLYGISNCDTIRKAKKWLSDHQIEFSFHDYRKDGIDKNWLVNIEKQIGWETLLNKRGTTYRQLPESDKEQVDKDKALSLLVAHPAMIKRPILEHKGSVLCGFTPDKYQEVIE